MGVGVVVVVGVVETVNTEQCRQTRTSDSVLCSLQELDRCCVKVEVAVLGTLPASLSGTFLQTLPDLVTPLKGH